VKRSHAALTNAKERDRKMFKKLLNTRFLFMVLLLLSNTVQAERVIQCPAPDMLHFTPPSETPTPIRNWGFYALKNFDPFNPPQARYDVSFVGGHLRPINPSKGHPMDEHYFECYYAVKKPQKIAGGSFVLTYRGRFIPNKCTPSGEKNSTITCH
jgi:hypothetical protein